MKKLIRICSFLIVVTLLFSSMHCLALVEKSDIVIALDNVYGSPEGSVNVDVTIENNPGILGATLCFTYDNDLLTLTNAVAGDAFSALIMSKPGKLTSPCRFSWDGESLKPEDIKDGIVLTLTFQISENAIPGTDLDIEISYSGGDIVDSNLNPVNPQTISGTIQVIDYTPGDVDGDKVINAKDLILIRRYINGGYDVTINEYAADVNDDGKINTTDIILIRRYIAGGYGVKLKPSHGLHEHTMKAFAYKAPTCEKEGNEAYWYCSGCERCFSDIDGLYEITVEETVIPAKHNLVYVKAQAPTTEKTGNVEHWKCNSCNNYFGNSNGTVVLEEKDVIIPKISKEESTVVYNIYGSDSYLESVGVDNSKNKTVFYCADGLVLNDIIAPEGYIFKGWTTASGTPITEIEPHTTSRQIVLNAVWEKNVYRVTFDTPDVSVKGTKITGEEVVNYTEYTVDTGVTLRRPECYGYTFVGWSNDNGFIVDRINPGTTGHITLHANWTSNRNRATSYSNYGTPIIIEDDTTGQFLFVYDIGRIDNVPLYVYLDENGKTIGANGTALNIDMTYEISEQFSEVEAKEVVKTVADATTRSSGWTLSEEWNDLYSEGTEYADKQIKSEERTDSQGNVVGGNYFVSNSQGGSSFISTESGGSTSSSSKVTTDKSFGINASYDKSTEKYCDATLSAENKTELSAGVEAPVGIAKVSAGVKNTTTIGAEVSNGRKDNTAFHIDGNYSSSVGTVDINDSSSYFNVSTNQSSNWNSTTGYEKSYQTSINTAVSEAIAQEIAKTTNYNISKSLGGGSEYNTAVSGTSSTEKGYSNSLQVSEHYSKTTTKHVKYSNSEIGYYRVVMAGTVHVYGVVGYDVATASYYTYTYNVLADETFEYVDYSKERATFDDCENGVVTFEIPYEVNEYILGVTSETAGLEIGLDGTVNDFKATESFKGTVVVPQYHAETLPGSDNVALKTKAISSTAFANNTEIKTVILPIYVTEIPEGAFEGCTNLETVIAYGVTKIGKNAFKGCTSLKKFYVDNCITELGTNAFENVSEIAVMAYDSNVADAAIKSGAKKITVDVSKITDSFNNKTVTVYNTTDYFAIVGNGGEYANLQINSNAKETLISKMTFVKNSDTPLIINSDIATLSVVSVEKSPVYALQLGNDNTDLKLYGEINLSSQGENTVISKNVTLSKANNNITSKLNITGKYLVCGEVANKESFLNVEPTTITTDEYNIYISPVVIIFDANGGNVNENARLVFFNSKIGELPTPNKTGYDFVGWFTENDVQVTADCIMNEVTDITVFAKWKAKSYSIRWNETSGVTIIVDRTSSPNGNASTGALKSGDTIYYGDVISVSYTANTGYTLTSKGNQNITVTDNLTSSNIYASVKVNSYTVNWNIVTGANITVKRTSSPKAGASIGTLNNGDTIYHGDVLTIVYTADTGYHIAGQGKTSIEVIGNVTKDDIHVSPGLNRYTYKVIYQSSNGVFFESVDVEHSYGSTHTLYAPDKSGYNTPAPQTVKWDSTDVKTIVFSYTPIPTATSQYVAGGTWWYHNGAPRITYSVNAEYRNRTATTVQVRFVWTNTIVAYHYYGYAQTFYASAGGVGTGNVLIASSSLWNSSANYARSQTVYSGWVTVSVTESQTSVSLAADYWDVYGKSSWVSSIAIPKY